MYRMAKKCNATAPKISCLWLVVCALCAAMAKKKMDPEAHMREYETRDGLALQLQGGFDLPTAKDAYEEAQFLEDTGALLPLDMAPLRPRAGE